MYAAKSYRIVDFIVWTRRPLYAVLLLNTVLVVLYHVLEMKWILVPWGATFLVGTTVAFMSGFKSTQTYNRTWEAQQVWASIVGMSRVWGTMCKHMVRDADASRKLIYGHLAWLTTLRYEMREAKQWESLKTASNAEYRERYGIPEKNHALHEELTKYLSTEYRSRVLVASTKASRALALQSELIRESIAADDISNADALEMNRLLRDLNLEQAKSERVKNYPYPRQYAVVNTIFVRILALLLPLGIIGELDRLNEVVDGAMRGQMVWLAIPLSALIAWMYLSLDQVGESSSNPFEGGPNDVPISQICISVENELREMLGEQNIPVRSPNDKAIVL